ncbi:alpha-amylase family protein [Aquibacillus saliphilus]|uniref:alpha-amylase family protein n=1 Tax=Aquibacillus saliphilus TaxID=1909422 RepID=UPI001CF039E3|nr:alpha-amylase family protein [Aquibacillus saliphilus]
MSNVSYRQVHLDFHTSEYIPDVANGFDGEEFAETLLAAYVDSVTCFARCHHGWLYYPSKNRPDLIHPNIKNRELLLEQINACHQKDIKVPIYTTVQWDAYIAREFPEWLSIDESGKYINTQNVPEPHFYYTICLNSDYRTYFKEHLQDIIDVVEINNIDGFFLDILFEVDCHCDRCINKMQELDFNVNSLNERMKYATYMLNEFKKEISEFIKERVPHAGIFYNSSHVGPKIKPSLNDYTHLELESLPSGGWGYDHFPSTVRYARKLGKEIIGMTGKFHTYWGDFHSLKNKAALEFECFNMIASGAGSSIGDQLHPSGKLSPGSYQLIGSVYERISKMEDYCRDSTCLTEIAVLTPEEQTMEKGGNLGVDPSLIGAVRLLQELSYQFDIIDSNMVFEDYKLIILPDHIQYSKELENKLLQYTSSGGKVIATHKSLAKDNESENKLFGINWLGESYFDREFVLPNETIGKNLHPEEYVMYKKGSKVEATKADVLMHSVQPYFNREGKTFCSHQHSPSSKQLGHPAVTMLDQVIYFSHPIFDIYRKNAPFWCKAMLNDAIKMVLDKKLVEHNGPATLITSLQVNENRNAKMVHLLHYITEKKSEDIYTIEETIPLYHLDLKVHVGDMTVTQLKSIPTTKKIDFDQKGEYVTFQIDKLDGHMLVVMEGEN